MKLNNKGFALSTTLYVILILAVVLITLTLSILSNRKIILDKQREEATNSIYGTNNISCRETLAILKQEAIDYLLSKGLNHGEVAIKNLNSGVYEQILNKYKLWDKLISIKYENYEYSASLVNGLPKEYQQVEYIESTGAQYINIGYLPSGINHPTKIVADAKFNSIGSAMALWGECTTTAYSYLFGFWSSANGQWGFARFASGGGSSVFFGNVDTERHIFAFEYNVGMSIDGIVARDTIRMASGAISKSKDLTIFARNYADAITQYSNLNLYSFKIYDDTNLSMSFISCYHKTSGIVGLYDIANGGFYTNAGTGTFISGEDVLNTNYWEIEI